MLVLPALSAVGSCDAPDDAGAPEPLSMEAMPSPAGEGSGEPFLSSDGDGVLMSWQEPDGEADHHRIRFARLTAEGWSPPRTIASGPRFFVNWADFPSIQRVDDALVAHWLLRGPRGGYDYGVRIVRSVDGGESWSEPWTPHLDGTPTEHGFVSVFPHPEGGVGLVWLDGRTFVAGPAGGDAPREMTLRSRTVGADGEPGPEILVDGRVCDCCQTDAALTPRGPVVVYRDRSPDEIRDIRLVRLEAEGWSEGRTVHADGWHIESCPVNGPAVAADGEIVVVAWFTAAGDAPRVKVAFSSDAGDSFADPVVVDDGRPVGRVDVVLLPEGDALVSWLERTGEGAEIRIRRIGRDGATTPSRVAAVSSAARASGFPRMVRMGDDALVLAWTDLDDRSSRIRVARLDLDAW